jgi:hypothetical protein
MTAAAIGAVAGAVGGATFGAGTAIMGTGFGATVAAGALSGATAGQTARAATNVVAGQQITLGLGDPSDMATDAIIGGAFAGVGYGVQQLLRGPSTQQVLQRLANQADTAVPGSGPVAGTQKHTVFRNLVRSNRPDLHIEQTILPGGIEAPYGTRGAIRLDVIEGPVRNPTAVYDLKTDSAQLTSARIQQIRNYYNNPKLPVIEIKPQ